MKPRVAIRSLFHPGLVRLALLGAALVLFLSGPGAPSSSEEAADFDPSRLPLGWWKLDETDGTTAGDGGWVGHPLALESEAKWAPGRLGGALVFDGRRDFVSAGSEPAFNVSESLTLSAWVNVAAAPIRPHPAVLGKAGSYALGLSGNTTRPVFRVRLDDEERKDSYLLCSAKAPLELGSWHHIAATYGAAERRARLYVDGLEACAVRTRGEGPPIAQNDAPLELGRWAESSSYFQGRLDDARIYGRVLSSSEIAEMASSESDPAPAAPTDLTAAPAGEESITLGWNDEASTESGFLIERKSADSNGRYSPLLYVDPDDTTVTDGDLRRGATYVYRMRSYSRDGFSAYSSEAGASLSEPTEELPLGWWKLDDVHGAIAADEGRGGHDGALRGGSRWIDGADAGALELNGLDSYVEVGSPPEYDLERALTLSAWVNVSAAAPLPNPVLLGKAGAFVLGLEDETTRPRIEIETSEAGKHSSVNCVSPHPLETGWHHLAGVYDPPKLRLFVDGAEVCRTKTEKAAQLSTNEAPLMFGLGPSRSYFKGALDDIRLYDRALGPEEVFALAVAPWVVATASSATSPGSASPPLAAAVPTLTAAEPGVALAGGGAATVTLRGADFTTASRARFAGTSLSTTFVSPTELAAEIPASLLASAGQFLLDVVSASNGTSNAISFVVVDPSGSKASFQDGVSPTGQYAGSRDAYLNAGSKNTNYGSATSLWAHGGPDRAPVLQWDLAPAKIPPGSSVLSAWLTLYVDNTSPNRYPIYEMKRSWVESRATWNRYDSGKSWQTPGALGVDDRGSAILGFVSALGTGSHTYPLSAEGVALVQKWVDQPGSNRGVLIQKYDNSNTLALASSEVGQSSRRPRLIVVYNQPPHANDQTVTTAEDAPVAFRLGAIDAEGDPLSYFVVTEPVQGVVVGAGPEVTYVPAANYSGPDRFTFKVNDGRVDSNVATVSITVTAVLDPVAVSDMTMSVSEDTTAAILLTASGGEGPVAFTVLTSPREGTLSGNAPDLTYQPRGDFNGIDSFTFKASDGVTESGVATVYLAVSASNDAPVAHDQRVLTEVATPVSIALSATDPEGAELQFEMVSPPEHGSLSGSGRELLYTPDPAFAGFDGFTFLARDEALESNLARVTLVVGHPAPYRIVDLGTLGGRGSSANAINARSQIVGRADLPSSSSYHPFLITPLDTNGDGQPDRWYEDDPAAGANVLMRDLMSAATGALGAGEGISAGGDVAGTVLGSLGFNPGKAFRWREGALETLFTGGARDVHADGWVVGSLQKAPVSLVTAVVYNPDTDRFVELGLGLAEAVNDAGVVVGFVIPGFSPRPVPQAFLFRDADRDSTLDPGELELLGGPPGFVGSAAHDVNASGQIAASAAATPGATHAYRVTRSPTGLPIWTALGTLGGDRSQALAINAGSQIVGLATLPQAPGDDPRQRAFLWEGGVLRDLNLLIDSGAGLVLEQANDINDRGEIVGEATNRQGDKRAVLLLPQSLPSGAPQAVIQASPLSGEAPLRVRFDGSGSSDPEDGGQLTFRWDFGDGDSETGPSTVEHLFDLPGSYAVTLTVADTWNIEASAQVAIDVAAPPPLPAPPNAVLGANPVSGEPPLTVQFDGSGSTSGVAITSYSWIFGDGGRVIGPDANVAHRYEQAGLYTARLTVRDERDLVASATVTIAVGSDAGLWAWGRNILGEVGDGTTTPRPSPVPVLNLLEVASVAGGTSHSLALRTDGTVWGWGSDCYGELGDGVQEPCPPSNFETAPVSVPGLSGITAIAASDHSLALESDGTVWAWGENQNGQVGDGTHNDRFGPVRVSGISDVVAISAGNFDSLALKGDGTVWVWGFNWAVSPPREELTPVPVSGLSGVIALAAGAFHNLALRSDGTVWAWGENGGGQLGDGTTQSHYTPAPVSDLSDVVAIAASPWQGGHNLALRSDGTVWAWGFNSNGQIGDGTTENRLLPVPVSGLSDVVDIGANFEHSAAVRRDGIAWTWGRNTEDQLGDGTQIDRHVPTRVPSLAGLTSIEAGPFHTLTVGLALNRPPVTSPTVAPSDQQGNGLGYIDPLGASTTTFVFAANATDPNGDPLSFSWDVDSDGDIDCTTASCSHAYAAPGQYLAELTVRDSAGLESTALLQVNVHSYLPPKAVLTHQVDGLGVSFDASGSEGFAGSGSPEGIVSYQWSFGDESSEASLVPTLLHEYAKPGTYTVTLEVENTIGLSDSVQATLTLDYPDDLFDKFGANDTRDTADPLLPVPNVLEPDKGYHPPIEGKTKISYDNARLVLKRGNEDWYEIEVDSGADYQLEVASSFLAELDGTPATGSPALDLHDQLGNPVLSSSDGILDFRNVPPGRYTLRVSGAATANAAVVAASPPLASSNDVPPELGQPVETPPPANHEIDVKTAEAEAQAAVAALAATSPILYDQYDSPSGAGFTSNDFSDLFGFDAELADDFDVPPGFRWSIESVEVQGSFTPGQSGFQSVNLFFYTNNPVTKRPAFRTCSHFQLTPTVNDAGSFGIDLPTPCNLPAGKWWLMVQANVAWRNGSGSSWHWGMRTIQSNEKAQWQNPAGGFGFGCRTWGDRAACDPVTDHPDQVFRLRGNKLRLAPGWMYIMSLRLLQAPLVRDQEATVGLNEAVTIPLPAWNRLNEPLLPTEYDAAIATPPRFGSIVLDSINEQVLYIPTEAGQDTFEYTASQPEGGFGSGRKGLVTITVEPRFEITEIGPTDGSSWEELRLHDINNLDHVVGELRLSGGNRDEAFVWRDGAYTMLDDFVPDSNAYSVYTAHAINDRDHVVGAVRTSGFRPSEFGVVAAPSGGAGDFKLFPLGHLVNWQDNGKFVGTARGINDGNVVVGSAFDGAELLPIAVPRRTRFHSAGGNFDVWRLQNEFMDVLLPGSPGQAEDVNLSGISVGWIELAGGIRPLRWPAGGLAMEFLPALGGSTADAWAYALNDEGYAVGESAMQNEVTHAVLWPPGTVNEVLDLGALQSPALKSVAFDVNDPGDVVGSSDTLAKRAHAFLWANGRMFDLNDTIDETLGWELNEATAVNDAGTIAGNGLRNGQPRGFILKSVYPIQAEDENVYTPWNEPVEVELRAEPDDPSHEFIVVVTPLHGSVSKVSRNRFRYTPEPKSEPGPAVADVFEFVVQGRSKQRSNVAAVRIMEASYEIVEIEPPVDREPVTRVVPVAINNAGSAVGWVTTGGPETATGFVWNVSSGMTLIEHCPGGRFIPNDINEQGSIAGTVAGVSRAAVSDVSQCRTIDEVLDARGLGLNEAGEVVGEFFAPELMAFHWEPVDRIAVVLDTLGGPISSAEAINDAGWITGYSQNEEAQLRAFILHLDGAASDLGTLGGESSQGAALSQTRGSGAFYVVGSAQNEKSVYRPVRWHLGGDAASLPEDLGEFSLGSDTEAHAASVNRNGDVVGYVVQVRGSDNRAFLWKESGFVLDLNRVVDSGSGWDRLEVARGVNDLGWVVGTGRKEGDTAERAFLLVPSLKRSAPLQVNLNVDSDNDDGGAPPDGSLEEEQKEDDPRGPGKILFANNADKNGNEIPGYSDRAPADGLYVPMRVEVAAPGRSVPELRAIAVQLDYPGLAPLPSFEPYPLGRFQAYVSAKNSLATLRLWKSTTALRDVLNYLEPRRPYSLEELGFDLAEMAGSGRGEVLLYLEGINSTAGLPAGIEATVGDGARIARDRVYVTVVEPTLGVNGSGPTTGVPDVDFQIDNLDTLVKDQGEGFSFWFADVRATQPTLIQKDDLVDLFPLRFNMPGELVGESQVRLYWSLDAADDVTMVLHPAVAPDVGKRRRAYVQEDAVALKQLQRIQEGAAVDRSLFSGGLLEVSPIKGGAHELIAGVNASLGGAVPALMTLRLIAGPPGLASPGQGQIVDSVRLTIRPIEEHLTLASARSARDREYDYPSDRDLVRVEVYRTPSWGDGVSGKDPTREPHKKKFLVYLHGGLTPPHEAEESSQSFFKRTYWLGYRGHFIGFTWESDQFFPGLNPYNLNAENAVLTAPGLRQFLEETVAGNWGARAKDVDVVAHSMGNLVMMDALRIGAYDKQASQGPDRLVNNVVQMAAATWLEAYELEGPVTYTGVDPIVYEVSDLERSSFHHWFNRRGRPTKQDGGVMTGRLYHAHNPRDKVLPRVQELDYFYNAFIPRRFYGPESGYHFDRAGQYRRSLPPQSTWFRGPTPGSMPDGRFVVSVSYAPSLLYTLNNGRPRYDNRRFDYGLDALGLMSGQRALSFADVNYEVPEELDDFLAHGFFLSRPLPEVYRFYEEFLSRAIPLGQP